MMDGSAGLPSDLPPDRPVSDGKHKRKALEAASFIIIGFGLSQAIRLAGNIVLTRLLAPEIFGVIGIARVFFLGLALFSDIGLEPAIIRSKRAGDPAFLNTAWTIQAIRNFILAVLAIVIGIPVSILYKEPILAVLIAVIGLQNIPDGFRSTSLVMLDKELQQKKITYMELTIQVVSLLCMIVAAYLLRNVWALMIGDIMATFIKLVWSHLLNKEHPNRLHLEREAARELLSFGKWILFSTAMTFLASQADRFILGKLFTMSWFGIYGVAVGLAELPKQVINRLNGKVIFPLITKYSHLSNDELREKMKRPRLLLLLGFTALLAVVGCFGDILVYIMYDKRYHAAAWILPFLVFGMWPLLLRSTNEGSLFAIGKPKYAAVGNLAKFIYMVISLPLAHKLGGELAVIVAIALNDLPSYVIVNAGLLKERLSHLRQDAALTLALIAIAGLLLVLRHLVGMGMPGNCPWFM